MYIFIPLHIVNQFHTKSAVFSPKITMITNVILIFFSSINKKLIKRLLDTILPVFALFHQQKSLQTQSQHCFVSLSNMTVIRS